MKVFCNSKCSTDKIAEILWDEGNILFEELVATAKERNISNIEITPIEACCDEDSL